MHDNTKRGFTLIELVIAVLIIGILAAVAVPQYQKAVLKSHVTHAIQEAESIVTAEELYYLANGKYGALSDLDIQMPANFSGKLLENNSVVVIDIQNNYNWKYLHYFSRRNDKYAGRRVCRVHNASTKKEIYQRVCQSLAKGPVDTESSYIDYRF